jgi:hypothetical protein
MFFFQITRKKKKSQPHVIGFDEWHEGGKEAFERLLRQTAIGMVWSKAGALITNK